MSPTVDLILILQSMLLTVVPFTVREVQLEVFGVAELTMFEHKNGEPPELNSPVIIEFPMDSYSDRFEAGQQIEAWYFDIDRGTITVLIFVLT